MLNYWAILQNVCFNKFIINNMRLLNQQIWASSPSNKQYVYISTSTKKNSKMICCYIGNSWKWCLTANGLATYHLYMSLALWIPFFWRTKFTIADEREKPSSLPPSLINELIEITTSFSKWCFWFEKYFRPCKT